MYLRVSAFGRRQQSVAAMPPILWCLMSDPTPGVWGRPRGTSAGLYRGLPYKPGHAYETNPRHRGGNRGSERRVREAEEDTREAEEDKE